MSVRTLHPDQVWDTGRSCFFAGLEPDGKNKHKGEQVYKAKPDHRFIIVPRPFR